MKKMAKRISGNDLYTNLTRGKDYEVLHENSSHIRIVNDVGETFMFCKYHFEIRECLPTIAVGDIFLPKIKSDDLGEGDYEIVYSSDQMVVIKNASGTEFPYLTSGFVKRFFKKPEIIKNTSWVLFYTDKLGSDKILYSALVHTKTNLQVFLDNPRWEVVKQVKVSAEKVL